MDEQSGAGGRSGVRAAFGAAKTGVRRGRARAMRVERRILALEEFGMFVRDEGELLGSVEMSLGSSGTLFMYCLLPKNYSIEAKCQQRITNSLSYSSAILLHLTIWGFQAISFQLTF